nr:hypothetical protein [Tanacetum cinerariifolium]
TFDELPFEEEILAFLRYLRHSGEIKKITDVNINKLHQPWRSFAAVINKCLSGKSTGYDRLRLSQAQVLWGMYHKKNVDFAYLIWEDFVYQVEHKDAKKRNEMYYPRFTKVIINFFMTKDPSIPTRNKVNWHYVSDYQMFTTTKLISRHQNTQQFGAMLRVELTNEDIRNSAAYKEYYAIASGAAPPKTKVSVRKSQSSYNTTITPPTAAGTRLSTLAKGKQPVKSSKAKDEGTSILPRVFDVPTDVSDEEISWKSSDEDDDDVDDQSNTDDDNDDDQDDNNDDQDLDNDDDDVVHPKLSTHDEEAKDEESFDPIVQTPSHEEKSNNEGNDDVSLGMNVGSDEGPDAKNDDDELYEDLNINLEGIDSLFESTPRVDVQVTTTVAPLPLTAPTRPLPSIHTISQVQQVPAPTPKTSTLQDLLDFSSLFGFDHRLKNLEANFSEFMQTNQFTGVVSYISGIVDIYIDHRMNEAVKVAVHIQSDRLRDEAQAKNDDFLNKLNENIQKIIKEQVKVQVSKILPKIEKTINEQLEAEVLTRSSNSTNTSYAMAADLSEVELKKNIIEKMESNKRRDDADKDVEPFARSDRGSKRKREGKEPESTSAPKEKASKTTGKSTEGSKSHPKTANQSVPVEELIQTTQDLEEPSHQEFETGAADDQPIAEAS